MTMTNPPRGCRPTGALRWRRALAVAAATVTLLVSSACGAPSGGDGPVRSNATDRPSASEMPTDGSGSTSPTPSVRPTSDAASAGTSAGEGGGDATYPVVSVVDGDTIKVSVDGVKTTVRIIGIDTPETKKPRVPVQCYGKEASSNMQSLVQSKRVRLEADASQGDRDPYGRLLRHVIVGGSTNVGLAQIQGGFAREYTYAKPYAHRLDYLAAQAQAKAAHRGTWGPPCNGFHTGQPTAAVPSPHSSPYPSTSVGPLPSGGCQIKGNITARGEKIAHLPGSRGYARTRIDTSKGERMFCTAEEARSAGWHVLGG